MRDVTAIGLKVIGHYWNAECLRRPISRRRRHHRRRYCCARAVYSLQTTLSARSDRIVSASFEKLIFQSTLCSRRGRNSCYIMFVCVYFYLLLYLLHICNSKGALTCDDFLNGKVTFLSRFPIGSGSAKEVFEFKNIKKKIFLKKINHLFIVKAYLGRFENTTYVIKMPHYNVFTR